MLGLGLPLRNRHWRRALWPLATAQIGSATSGHQRAAHGNSGGLPDVVWLWAKGRSQVCCLRAPLLGEEAARSGGDRRGFSSGALLPVFIGFRGGKRGWRRFSGRFWRWQRVGLAACATWAVVAAARQHLVAWGDRLRGPGWARSGGLMLGQSPRLAAREGVSWPRFCCSCHPPSRATLAAPRRDRSADPARSPRLGRARPPRFLPAPSAARLVFW